MISIPEHVGLPIHDQAVDAVLASQLPRHEPVTRPGVSRTAMGLVLFNVALAALIILAMVI